MITLYKKGARDFLKGFSLVELLVVIGIIGILVAIVYANFAQGRAQTRDKVRQTTLADIQLAVEQYKAQTGTYPLAGCGATLTQWATNDGPAAFTGAAVCSGSSQFILGLIPSYLPSLPNPGRLEGKGFYYRSDGNSYKIIVYQQAETLTITSFDQEFAACPPQESGTGSPLCAATAGAPTLSRTYAVYSLGAERW